MFFKRSINDVLNSDISDPTYKLSIKNGSLKNTPFIFWYFDGSKWFDGEESDFISS